MSGGFFYVLQDEARILFVDDDPILRAFAQVNLATPATEIDLAAAAEANARTGAVDESSASGDAR